MNANELANELERPNNYQQENNFTTQAATMLRQQQAEIEALKKEAALQRLSDFTQEAESFDRTASHMAGEYVSYKLELTDEEMYQLAEECGFNVDGKAINDGIETAADFHNELFEFAKAILRKAQDK
ncbi:hypothetical protein UFOVP230_28 [uncultured Caudovirales phage]|uniref:Uncharacterized protein n=1 Tax=uncultured Caudovirales phage TaxID=2100421 RepID=A0A6J7XNC7_9CAUD|nr:hypothetical protein UFOVP230_28 [uncultured Caudovirales phage]